MGEVVTTNRRGFFRLAGAAGLGAGLLSTGAAGATMIERASRPVWAFHPDFLYLDTSGSAVAYAPPPGAQGAAHLTELDTDQLDRMSYYM